MFLIKIRNQNAFFYYSNWNMNIGIIFELALACFFIYTPHLNGGLQFIGIQYVFTEYIILLAFFKIFVTVENYI